MNPFFAILMLWDDSHYIMRTIQHVTFFHCILLQKNVSWPKQIRKTLTILSLKNIFIVRDSNAVSINSYWAVILTKNLLVFHISGAVEDFIEKCYRFNKLKPAQIIPIKPLATMSINSCVGTCIKRFLHFSIKIVYFIN